MGRITCRVCGEALLRHLTPPVSCLTCETSYHVDCWAFNGAKCGVYGCEGRRAVAGFPRYGTAPPAAQRTRCVWHRGRGAIAVPLLGAAALSALVAAGFFIPWSGLYLGIVACQLSRLLADTLTWLRSVELDDHGLTLGYLVGAARRVAWADVARGPGAAGWEGILQLRNGERLSMPRGEPGFDEVVRRMAISLAQREVGAATIFIGEDA